MGCDTTRIGHAGEDTPKFIEPSHMGVLVEGHEKAGTSLISQAKLNYFKEMNEVRPLLNKEGYIEDFDRFEAYMKEALKDYAPGENPVILSEPSFHDKGHRMKMVKSMFESLGVPCVFVVKSGVLSSFSCGKSTCLVLDSGHHSTWAVPVHEGYVLQKSTKRDEFAGAALSSIVEEAVRSKGLELRPHFSVKRSTDASGALQVVDQDVSKVTDSYKELMKGQLLKLMK